MKKISIICATFNATSTIDNLLKSIFAQDFCNYEVIIIDGASTDNTLERVHSFNFPQLTVVSERDSGIYDAMNKGIEIASGDWLFFIGADDKLYDSTTLSIVSKLTKNHNHTDAICGNVLMGFDNNVIFIPKISSKLLFINSIHHQGIFYNKKLFIDYKYNIEYSISADYELNLMLYLKKASFVYTNTILSVTGQQGASSRTNKAGYLEEIDIRTKLIKNPLLKYLLNIGTILRFILKKYGLKIFLQNI